jgi:hypothetical protein
MTRTKSSTVVSVEELVELEVVSEVGVVVELLDTSIVCSRSILLGSKDVDNSRREEEG